MRHQNPVTTSIYACVNIDAAHGGPPVDGGGVMDLDAMLKDYLAVRCGLGVKLAREEKLIRQFLALLAAGGMSGSPRR
jgi:hypothetical protein